jgi:hypothetical protein
MALHIGHLPHPHFAETERVNRALSDGVKRTHLSSLFVAALALVVLAAILL